MRLGYHDGKHGYEIYAGDVCNFLGKFCCLVACSHDDG